MGGSARAKTGRKGVKKGLGNLKMPILAISDRSESENLDDFEVPDPSESENLDDFAVSDPSETRI